MGNEISSLYNNKQRTSILYINIFRTLSETDASIRVAIVLVPERDSTCYFSCSCSCCCCDAFEKVLRLFHFFTERDEILYEHTRDNSSSIDGFRFLNFETKFENAAKIGFFAAMWLTLLAWPQNDDVMIQGDGLLAYLLIFMTVLANQRSAHMPCAVNLQHVFIVILSSGFFTVDKNSADWPIQHNIQVSFSYIYEI